MTSKSEREMDPKNYVASVEKALRLIELFDDGSPQLALHEIVKRAGYSRTATYRLLTTLEHLDWIVRKGDKYQLSLKVFRIGTAAVNALQLRQEASPSLSELSAQLGETVYLIVPDGTRAVCLERIEGSSQVQIMVLEEGKSLPLYVGGGSLALLAHRDDLMKSIGAHAPFTRHDGRTMSMEDLLRTADETRERGYSRSIEDVTPGVAAFGAPVFDRHGQAIAAISVGGLCQTLLAKEAALSKGLMKAANDISVRLGHTPRLS